FVTGCSGGAGLWPRAGLNGIAVGVLLLLLMWGCSHGGPTAGEACFCLLALPLSSSLGALLGANLSVKRLRAADR
ncbi:MAG: hypothetical protein ACPLTR_06765, partial [Thermacetogeniaceae bacterium]